jgi:YD repeat-containing protein
MQYTPNTPNLTYGQSAGDSAYNARYGANGQLDSLWTQGDLAFHAFLQSATGLTDSVRAGGTDSLLTVYTYDAHRRVLTVKDANGHTTTYAYDAASGNVDSVVAPGGLFAVRKFDAFGRDTADFAKGVTYWVRTQYDTLNRVVKTWPRSVSGDTTTVTYDALFPTRVKTPGGSVFKSTTNASGWITARYSAVDTTKSRTYRYDLGGRLTSWTNRRGQRVDIVFDSLSRVIRQSGTNIPTDTLTYSLNGLIQTAKRGTISLDSTYSNVAGQPDSIVHHIRRRFIRWGCQ